MNDLPDKIPFHVDIDRIIELLAKQIYQSPLALLRENTQNAYDAVLQRLHLGQIFEPAIEVTIEPSRIIVQDNGIGMTRSELDQNYWHAGSSGKNNDQARAAGVVGTFGIGAMANFGAASHLEVQTESARGGMRTLCRANKATLSATDPCIEMIPQTTVGIPGTTVTATIDPKNPVSVAEGTRYIRGFVQYLPVPVHVNGELVSQRSLDESVTQPSADFQRLYPDTKLGSSIVANVDVVIGKSGEIWVKIDGMRHQGIPSDGLVILRQGLHQLQAFRSRFALSAAGFSSYYRFGGIANLPMLQPTAGREAITTESMSFLQSLISSVDAFVSPIVAATPFADSNSDFMSWAQKYGRFDLCGNLSVTFQPSKEPIRLTELREFSKSRSVNYYDGSDAVLIDAYSSEETPLLIASRTNPRKACETGYIRSYCSVNRISNQPTVLSRLHEYEWSLAQSAFAFRVANVLEYDYFLASRISYGKISHGLNIITRTDSSPVEIVLNPEWNTIKLILQLYETDLGSFAGIVKDFIRTVVFPKVESLVPSSTRQGAAAFLKAIRKPKDTFEYGAADTRPLGEVWGEYLDGKLSFSDAARISVEYARANVQVVDRSHTVSVSQVAPDILENQRILAEGNVDPPEPEPLPAITRPERETDAKLLIIPATEPSLKGYRCFLAVTDRVREERSDFFLQPHWTEIVWGGQKVLFIFQHHSREFGLYYELQTTELVSETPGGERFPTCTMILGNTIFIPVPEAIAETFLPPENGTKRFEVRFDLLYPDFVPAIEGSDGSLPEAD